MKLHIIFDKTARYSIDLSRFEITYPRQHTMVLKRIRQPGSFERSYEYIIIGFTKFKIFHCNIYTEHLNLDDDLPFEEIEEVIFKVGY